MAHVAVAEKRPDADEVIICDVEEPVPKRLKQGRLPFKPKDSKPLTPLSVNNSTTKKRKLSGQDSPNSKAKHPKLPDLRSGEKVKSSLNADNEVSSTSTGEAEHLPVNNSSKSKTVKGSLDSFVHRDDEISSTNEVIDLTDSLGENIPDENSPAKCRSPKKFVLKSPAKSQNERISQEKPAVHFSRKLLFGENKTSENEAEDNKMPEAASQGEEKEDSMCVDVSVESDAECADASEEEHNNTEKNSQESANSDMEETDAQQDSSLNSSTCETSMLETSAMEKEDESSPSSKTPRGKDSLSTSASHTPATVNTSFNSTDEVNPASDNKQKNLSKKQLERAALRQRVKEEKEKQKQEIKEQKEKERLDKKKKRDEEKAEKERVKKEEKEKKEKERLKKKEEAEKEKQEKLQQKEKEKQKKLDLLNAKSEEKKRKEEEKRQKEEQEQREAEEKVLQAEKRKAAFTSFFIKPKGVTSTKVTKAADNLFIPFEVKKDMTLAPIGRRQTLSEREKQFLDNALLAEKATTTYLEDLKQGAKQPIRTNRILRNKKEIEQEVELLVHDSETMKKVTHAVKLLQFHTDYRPPFFGTWRKKVNGLSPRNPWKKDEEVFDYEVDSDEEWEEEEPGESLSDSNGEEDEGEEDDEGEDDGWMVPHGYLSEDEGCEDDDDVTPEMLKARQRAKAQAWEAELKAKKQVLPPVHLGCFWLDNPCENPQQLNILKEFEMVCLRPAPVETQISCPAVCDSVGDKTGDKPSAKTSPSAKGRCRKQALPDEAMPDLIRLVHGNCVGIKKLVREFRLYWKQKTGDPNVSMNGSRLDEETKALDESEMETSVCLDSSDAKTGAQNEKPVDKNEQVEPVKTEVVQETKEEESLEKKQDDGVASEEVDNCVSKRQLEMKILAIAVREKREGKKKHCWYVNDDILTQYNMTDLPLDNSWVYVSGDLVQKTPLKASDEKKTPLKRTAEKKTPSEKSAEKKQSKDKTKKAKAISEETQTPLKETTVSCTGTSTPQTGKSKKETSAKKNPKDQPSIMAFAKKTPSAEKKNLFKISGDEIANKAAEVNDVEMEPVSKDEKETESSTLAKEQKMEDVQEGVSTENDCIIID